MRKRLLKPSTTRTRQNNLIINHKFMKEVSKLRQMIPDTIRKKLDMEWEEFSLGNKALLGGDITNEELVNQLDELGLEGQKQFIQDCEGSVIPFVLMTKSEYRVWSEFAPTKVPLEEFKAGIIPQQILEILVPTKKNCYFDQIQIWTEAVPTAVDPLVVGVKKDGIKDGWRTRDAHFLVARWGQALKSYEDVKEQVRQALLRKRRISLEEFVKKSQAALETNERFVEEYLDGTASSYKKDPQFHY